MVATEGFVTEAILPRPYRMKLLDAYTSAAHLAKHLRIGLQRAERVVDHINCHPLTRLFAQQIGECAPRRVVSENIYFQTDAARGALDRLIRRAQRFTVLVKLHHGAI